ncbi:glycosyl transferase [Thiomicrospira aerophila AL3]|uniref:Glycosyl transferase n=1 Tax=Thiomicrospira aerophila AL3 TaxID=717772 RepID=W0DVW3_9GAMM|nr:glycosyltransferase [Thiomicrospira aerophila]AHF01124.1 glycosyl transferase [Thiomicrospira aerophila AL3]
MKTTETKKITLLISSLAGGGAEGVCVNVANGLAEQGWQVDLVVLHLNNSAYHDRVSDKVNLVVLGVKHARYAGLTLSKYIHRQKPKSILVFNYELAVMLVILRTILRFKIKIIARNINTLSQKRKLAKGLWLKYIVKNFVDGFYGKVDHVINQCKAMQDDLLTLYPKLKGKTSVIYNPVAKHIEDYAKSHDLSQVEKRDYLLCVGRLEKQKAFHYAIEGFAGVANEFPNLRLKIVGQGSVEATLKQCAIDFGVADRVDFEGFQKDMIPYYLHAKATVLTSLYEGFPNVLVESITLGTPVVAFDCPSGPREIIEDRVNGYLVEYLNIKDFKAKLVQLLSAKFNAEAAQNTVKQNQVDEVVKHYAKQIACFD